MNTEPTIAERIVAALRAHLKRDAISIEPTHHLRDDLGLDSIAIVDLLYKVETTFDFQIPDRDVQGLATVGDVIRYVEARVDPRAVEGAP
jgi:acyl carrier protein